MKIFFRAICLAVLLSAPLSRNLPAQQTYKSAFPDSGIEISEKLSPAAERRLETFRLVWQTIRDNYFDQTFGGLNWNKIKTEFEPRALDAETDAELHTLLQEMINRLNKSHFVIIPPEVFSEIGRARAEFEENREAGETETNESTS